MTLGDRLQHAWNAFISRDSPYVSYGYSSSYRPDRRAPTRGSEKTIISTVINKIATDCASVRIEHVRIDDDGRYLSTVNSALNHCLTVESNIDQTGRAFIQDVVESLLGEGVIAIVPIETDIDPMISDAFKIGNLRVGRITCWYPQNVQVEVYNEFTGLKQEIVLPKRMVAIVENPFYSIMNEPNSTLQRLIHKLSLLDSVDNQSGSGKLDLIIQLPYAIKSQARKQQAEERRKDIEEQLSGSKYGIAYTDGTEHITQLNRSLENNLLNQVQYLTDLLFSQLGITTGILDGTADENTMTNYQSRIVEPILSAVVKEMKRKFLTKTARSQGQSIMFFQDHFKLVPVTKLADIVDKFTRNEIMSSNEVRQVLGMKPVNDPRADELRNKNISMSKDYQAYSNKLLEESKENNEVSNY